MLNVKTTKRGVLLPLPTESVQRRVEIIADIDYGPLKLIAHRPLDHKSGIVITDVESKTAIVFSENSADIYQRLKIFMEALSIHEYAVMTKQIDERDKQNTARFRSTHAVSA